MWSKHLWSTTNKMSCFLRPVQRLVVPALRRRDTLISKDLIAKNFVAAAKARGCPVITLTASSTLSDLCAFFCFDLCTLSVFQCFDLRLLTWHWIMDNEFCIIYKVFNLIVYMLWIKLKKKFALVCYPISSILLWWKRKVYLEGNNVFDFLKENRFCFQYTFRGCED